MSMAPAFIVKGWCPGALRPMESGDGLIMRVRPRDGSLCARSIRGIADAAEAFGNGHVDLTRRANLQLRGLRAETLGPAREALRTLGLLDGTAEAERIRNILVSPLAGLDPAGIIDMRPLAIALADRLAVLAPRLSLPAKFSFVLDGGGRLPLAGERADIRAVAIAAAGRPRIAIQRGEGEWLGMTEPENMVAAIDAILSGMPPEWESVETRNGQKQHNGETLARLPMSDLPDGVIGLGVPFGRMEAAQLRGLADMAPEIRLSPWRVVYIHAPGEPVNELRAAARGIGFVTDADDPVMRVQACPGRPACGSAHADTRRDALAVAGWMAARRFSGTAHVSACAKGCASSARADITLVGEPGGYRLIPGGKARDAGGQVIPASVIPASCIPASGIAASGIAASAILAALDAMGDPDAVPAQAYGDGKAPPASPTANGAAHG